MEYVALDTQYLLQATELAYQNYQREQVANPLLPLEGRKEYIQSELEHLFTEQYGIMMVEDDQLIGFLAFYPPWDSYHEGKLAKSPVFAYGINGEDNRESICSQLFQHAAQQLVTKGVIEFEISVYTTDTLVRNSYILNNFGILCTECVMDVNQKLGIPCCNDYRYMIADTSQESVASELLELYHQLENHLKCSPTFYPGYEFTDQVYMDYINSADTKVFIALRNGRIVGMIDASSDNQYLIGTSDTMFTGDIYFLPEERRRGGAQGLLQYAADYYAQHNITRFAVEHGTTNPNAIRFWDKYYTRYTYTMNRIL